MGYLIAVETERGARYISVTPLPSPAAGAVRPKVLVQVNSDTRDESVVAMPTRDAWDFALALLRAVEAAGGVT